jgi:hypothetical protein
MRACQLEHVRVYLGADFTLESVQICKCWRQKSCLETRCISTLLDMPTPFPLSAAEVCGLPANLPQISDLERQSVRSAWATAVSSQDIARSVPKVAFPSDSIPACVLVLFVIG